MSTRPLTVAWFSFFPVEWLPDVPDYVQKLPRGHPATWQRVLLEELETNPAFKLHVIVLRKQFDQDRQFERHGVTFHLLKTPGGLRAPSLFWLDTFRIRHVLRRVRPDVVHAWGAENGAALVASRLGYPYLVTMQGLMSWIVTLVPPTRYDRLVAFLEKPSLRRASLVTAESGFAIRYLREHHPHLDLRQVEHAPRWLFHQVLRQPQGPPWRFVFVGSLTHLKGVDLMLQALDRIKGEVPFELSLIAGPANAFLNTVKASVSAELWSRLTFHHNLTPEEISAQFATATLLLCPTRADNSPNAVKEAVVAGLPVVASAVGGIPDYVFPEENGLLFPAGDVAQCAAAIRAAMLHPLFSKGLVSSAALEKVRAYLSPEMMSRKFADLYRSLACPAG